MKTKLVFVALVAIATLMPGYSNTAGATSEKPKTESSQTTAKKEVEKPKEVTYTVKSGDTLEAIATANQTTYVRLFNANESIANPNIINVDDTIVIPAVDAELPDRYAAFVATIAQPVAVQPAQTTTYQAATTASAPATQSYRGSSAGNTYVWGNCTWYVKNMRPDLPNALGNGGQWAASAAAAGYATGSAPQPGAVAEQAGHVAYVESVNGNNVTVSEMNYNGGLGQVHTRTVPASTFYYIY